MSNLPDTSLKSQNQTSQNFRPGNTLQGKGETDPPDQDKNAKKSFRSKSKF
jgi:hypothetical protein